MKQEQLIPKPKREMKQPRKAELRRQLAEAHETIERQAAQLNRRPWWRRIFRSAE